MQQDSNQPTPDVILRSSDGKLFYFWKSILSVSSPVFGAMFSLPQPDCVSKDEDHHDGRPVIDLAEDSRTLGRFLSLCHPPTSTAKPFRITHLQELGAILEVAAKYDMENLCRVVLEELTNPAFLCEDPLRVYALACRYECQEAARLAAKHTLALPKLLRGYVPELEKICADRLYRLLLYRDECMETARRLAEEHTWIVYDSSTSALFGCSASFGCSDGRKLTRVKHPPSNKYRSGREELMYVHSWWMEYMRKSGQALQKSPHAEAVKEEKLVNDALVQISSSECDKCQPSQVREAFQSFVENFAKEIDRRVAQVEINLGF